MLKLSPTPAPIAVMRLRISSNVRTLSRRAFSTLRILPRSGRMACVRRSRPPLAVPPADAPLFRVGELAAEGEDGLRCASRASLGGSAGGIALHDVELAESWITL